MSALCRAVAAEYAIIVEIEAVRSDAAVYGDVFAQRRLHSSDNLVFRHVLFTGDHTAVGQNELRGGGQLFGERCAKRCDLRFVVFIVQIGGHAYGKLAVIRREQQYGNTRPRDALFGKQHRQRRAADDREFPAGGKQRIQRRIVGLFLGEQNTEGVLLQRKVFRLCEKILCRLAEIVDFLCVKNDGIQRRFPPSDKQPTFGIFLFSLSCYSPLLPLILYSVSSSIICSMTFAMVGSNCVPMFRSISWRTRRWGSAFR